MSVECEVAIIGAGPYGLAAAAHLRAARIETLVFGQTMAFWKRNMPGGMFLRSPWKGSHIADPGRALTLDGFAAARGLPKREPIAIDAFIRYGEWFQESVVPELDQRTVTRVESTSTGLRF